MKVLFAMPHPGHVRNFESVLRNLAARGHVVHLAFAQWHKVGPGHDADAAMVARLLADCPTISAGRGAARHDPWRRLLRGVRNGADYLRYEDPRFSHAILLRKRAAAQAPAIVRALAALPPASHSPRRARWLARRLIAVERAIPNAPDVDALLEAHHPDLVLVTPLVEVGSEEVEYVMSARALGYPSVLCVASWDNLTNKGLIRILPDAVVVWNSAQREEAISLHGVPPERVIVTGAQRFDEWFDAEPSRTRAEFCAAVGLPLPRPYVLYVCSSAFIAQDEVAFVKEWLRALRATADPLLASAGVLVRPHPQNACQWQGVDLSSSGDVVVWPSAPSNPVDTNAKADYFDSLYHCAAVVGVNTTALIEAGIVGRPVHTVLMPRFAGVQHGTLHFEHLVDQADGLLMVAASLEEHFAQLGHSLRGDPAEDARRRRFVERFVRPHGRDVAATPVFVEALERLAAQPRPRIAASPTRAGVTRLALFVAALAANAGLLARLGGFRPAWLSRK